MGYENDKLVGQNLELFILNYQPNLMFIHFDAVDDAGHATYWGSPQYYHAALMADIYIGRIINSLKKAQIFDKTLIIVTADHGGY